MKESVCIFGAERNLSGVLTEPNAELRSTDAPTVVLLNSGLLHRVGPNRSSVTLARRIAALGFTSLRFDQGGLGDSEPVRRTGSDAERALLDIEEALAFLESRKSLGRFVLVGLCSGADATHAAAVRDPRVVGVVQLDGYGYRTPWFHLTLLAERLQRSRSWKTLLRVLLWPRRVAAPTGEIFLRDFPPRSRVQVEIQALVDRGTELLFVYTSGVSAYYRYRTQFADMFPRLKSRGRIAVEFWPLADHTYTFREDRERMFATVSEWLRSRAWRADADAGSARLP